MTDFLLELRSEEIPARMQERAREDLARLFTAELARAGIAAAETVTYATPRRLALIARGLPDATDVVTVEVKGPKTSAPPQALEGFLRKTGLTREQLTERDGILFAVTQKPGRAAAAVLAEAISSVIRAFPWPKSMRWGAASASTESLRWVRPLHGIVALFGEALVPVEIAGITSGYATFGHRFHHPGPITIGSAADYVGKLRACHVIVDQAERARLIRDRAATLAAEAGLALVEDEGLVIENAGLTEWPVPLLGRFDPAFLDVPPEVIQLTARVNQKYFVLRNPPGDGEGHRPAQPSGGGGSEAGAVVSTVPPPSSLRDATSPSRGGSGALANAFICTANIDASDGGAAIVEGNRKVLAARLADARFFYEQDLKTPLAEQAKKLDRYEEKLGTLADKASRLVKTAEWLALSGLIATPTEELAKAARQGAQLCLADLPTSMVGEFPELEGLMGSYYAAAQGQLPEVCEAIRTQYRPRGPNDFVPSAPLSVIQALSYKVETRAAFFAGDIHAKGSGDQFGVRRTELGIIRLIVENGLRIPLGKLLAVPFLSSAHAAKVDVEALLVSFADRLKVQQREAGVRHDLIDAVFALGGEDDLVRLLARVRALQAFMATADGANLLTGYRRAANILKKEGFTPLPPGEGQGAPAPRGEGEPRSELHPHSSAAAPLPPAPAGRENSLSYTPEPAEEALAIALDSAEPRAAQAVAAEDFEGAMAALASLRAPIDRFFDEVTVNDSDPAKRTARLALLARMRDAVHAVADFSRIEGA
ncbi:glycine--tRNA ligase subunit beta [Sphingomonas sp.]|uniref:glycine--tRNA ligase subunit beta n=1 Tax=Sphingomonas sp. TaxID=28214 RepID=UPI003CC5BA21